MINVVIMGLRNAVAFTVDDFEEKKMFVSWGLLLNVCGGGVCIFLYSCWPPTGVVCE